MTVPESERRNRRHVLRTDCVATADDGARLLGDRISELSWDGAFVESAAAARVGEELRLSIRIPGSQVWVDAGGTIARIAAGRRANDTRGLGVRITRMDGMSRILLATVMRSYPTTTGGRRGGSRDYATMVARIAEHAERGR